MPDFHVALAAAKLFGKCDLEAAQLRQQIAELEAQRDLAVEAFYKIHDTAAPYDDGIKFGYIKKVALDALAAIKSAR